MNHRIRRAFGLHLTVDGYGCDRGSLADVAGIYVFLRDFPARIGMTRIMDPQVQEYIPPPHRPPDEWGLSGFVLIAESHISVHTFPDHEYLSADIFSCRVFDTSMALATIVAHFRVRQHEVHILDRGLEFPRSLKPVVEHLLKERGRMAPGGKP